MLQSILSYMIDDVNIERPNRGGSKFGLVFLLVHVWLFEFNISSIVVGNW